MYPPQDPPRRRPPPLPPTGTGNISFEGMAPEHGGTGLIVNDASARGFWVRVKAPPEGAGAGNRYGYDRADEGRPDTFPETDFAAGPVAPLELVVGTIAVTPRKPYSSTGAEGDAPAYEVTGRTDVPTDGTAIVWLEPLVTVPGYGFTYTPAAPDPSAYQSRSNYAGYAATPVGTTPLIQLPRGTWLVTAQLEVQFSAAGSVRYSLGAVAAGATPPAFPYTADIGAAVASAGAISLGFAGSTPDWRTVVLHGMLREPNGYADTPDTELIDVWLYRRVIAGAAPFEFDGTAYTTATKVAWAGDGIYR